MCCVRVYDCVMLHMCMLFGPIISCVWMARFVFDSFYLFCFRCGCMSRVWLCVSCLICVSVMCACCCVSLLLLCCVCVLCFDVRCFVIGCSVCAYIGDNVFVVVCGVICDRSCLCVCLFVVVVVPVMCYVLL